MAISSKEKKKDQPIAALGEKYRIIGIDRLSLDLRNYRIGVQTDEESAFRAMVSRLSSEIFELGKDIANSGLDPSLSLIVMRSEESIEKYTVIEGNRRLTALYMLDKPGRAKYIDQELFKKFQEIKNSDRSLRIGSVLCYVVDSREEAQRWMDLRHLGRQKGKGLLDWGSAERSRRKKDSGVGATYHHEILTYMQSKGFLTQIKDSDLKRRATNLDRVFGSRSFQDVIGVKITKGIGVTIVNDDEDYAHKIIQEIFFDFIVRGKELSDIYNKDNRKKYVNDLVVRFGESKNGSDFSGDAGNPLGADASRGGGSEPAPTDAAAEAAPTDATVEAAPTDAAAEAAPTNATVEAAPTDAAAEAAPTDAAAEATPTDATAEAAPTDGTVEAAPTDAAAEAAPTDATTGSGPIKDTLKRETLAPRDKRRALAISDPWVNRIYIEMRQLKVEDQPAIGSVMMRVFLESLSELYLERMSIPPINGKSDWSEAGINLASKVKSALYRIDPAEKMPDLIMARLGVSDKDVVHSVFNLHKFVHNSKVKANAKELKEIWDRWEPYMMHMCRALTGR